MSRKQRKRRAVLERKRERRAEWRRERAGPTAPAHGLILTRVDYE